MGKEDHIINWINSKQEDIQELLYSEVPWLYKKTHKYTKIMYAINLLKAIGIDPDFAKDSFIHDSNCEDEVISKYDNNKESINTSSSNKDKIAK